MEVGPRIDAPAAPDSLAAMVDDLGGAERARARRAFAVVALLLAGAHRADGAVTMGAWLTHHARMSRGAAGRLIAEGRFLHRYPAVAAAAFDGRLSEAQIAELRHVVASHVAWIFELQQAGVVDALAGLDLRDTRVALADWRQRADAITDPPPPADPDRSLTLGELDDGTHILRVVMHAGSGAALRHALETAHTYDGDSDQRSAAERSADAFDTIIEFFNANHARPGTPRHRPHVTLHMNLADLQRERHRRGPCGTIRDGQLVPDWFTDTLLCDCIVHRAVRAPGTILDYGRAVRTPPPNLYRAVVERDDTCRFCDRPAAWCDVHHIVDWHPDGETRLDNLLLLCGHHHRLVHRERWRIQLHPDGAVTFTHPDGHAIHRPPRWHPTTSPPLAA